MLQKRRYELGLSVEQVAVQRGVNAWTYRTWEAGRMPTAAWYPSIISLLGYEPWHMPQTLPEHLRAERLRRGLSIKAAALFLNVDEGTYSRWESGAWKPQSRSIPTIQSFLSE